MAQKSWPSDQESKAQLPELEESVLTTRPRHSMLPLMIQTWLDENEREI